MTAHRFLPLILSLFAVGNAHAMAPAGEEWFTIVSPHFRVHHTLPLERYARAATQAFEAALPELERRLGWKTPAPVDVIVMDNADSANGLSMNFPNNSIELLASPFGSDSSLGYYEDWANEIASHELTHMIANDTTLGGYVTLRKIFGSWVKPNGIQPVWLSEGLAVFQETSLSGGGRGRSPLVDALLREAVRKGMLDNPAYASLDRFNDGIPWWPSGNTAYLFGYTIQALAAKQIPNLPGKISFESGSTIIFAPDRVMRAVSGKDWASVWSGATARLKERYSAPLGDELSCTLTQGGRFTGGHALSPDGWLYFTEESWDHGSHLARVRSDAPCGKAEVERLVFKPFGGPTQVAVSPSGKKVAYAALDPGFETEFSDVYLWSEQGGRERVTKDGRTRDPAFANETQLLYVKALADTSQSIVQRDLASGAETTLYTSRALERVASLHAGAGRVVFSLHANDGHERIVELKHNGASYVPVALTTTLARYSFERNPTLTSDGRVLFAASYNNGPQAIFGVIPGRITVPAPQLLDASGYVDRPVLLPDGKTVIVQRYGLNGLDLVRAPLGWNPSALPKTQQPDLHEFLTGEKPVPRERRDVSLPASVPYSIENTGTSLWPHYWFPEVSAAEDGVLAGASTSGNDALNYHRYYAIAQWDSRARFPLYRAYYRNRANLTTFHFEATQSNNYFLSSKSSNRDAQQSVEAIFSAWDFSFAFGTAYRQKKLFGTQTKNVLVYQNTSYDRAGRTPSAIAQNWGVSFNNFVALYPSSNSESTFVDERPELAVYVPGFQPSHSLSVSAAAGISTNKFVASNYYQGGGASSVSSSAFVVRGYPTDTLFGQRVVTANLAYTLPLAHVHHGLGTNPLFLDTLGLRLMADAGSANFLAVYKDNSFLFYERDDLFRRMIYGGGVDALATGSIFYHVPVSVAAGVHYGSEKRYGGTTVFYFGVGIGLNRGTMAPRASIE